MSDIIWNVFEISVNLFESCVVIHFICAFLNHNFKTVKGKTVYIIGVMIDFFTVSIINHFVVYEGVIGLVYTIEYFVFSLVLLKGSIYQKVFAAIISPIVMICANTLVSGIISNIFKSEIRPIYDENTKERIFLIIPVQILLIIVFDLILKYSMVTLKRNEWKLILSVFGISFLSMGFIHISVVNAYIEPYYVNLLLIAEFGIIILNIVCFYITYALSKSNFETEELRMQRQQEQYRVQYADSIRHQYEEMRRIRHDMKQDIMVISALQREGKYKEAGEYARKISDNLNGLETIIDVENDFINAILNSKLSIAKARGIEVLCASSNNIDGVEDTDLCNLLGNMLDNAIEAAEKCAHGFIEVSINSNDDRIKVTIANSIQLSVLKNNKELKSTKSNADFHGYGVKTIKSIAKKYDGMAVFYEDGNMFYCQVIMYKQLLKECEII